MVGAFAGLLGVGRSVQGSDAVEDGEREQAPGGASGTKRRQRLTLAPPATPPQQRRTEHLVELTPEPVWEDKRPSKRSAVWDASRRETERGRWDDALVPRWEGTPRITIVRRPYTPRTFPRIPALPG